MFITSTVQDQPPDPPVVLPDDESLELPSDVSETAM
jgi:hypothetical protein